MDAVLWIVVAIVAAVLGGVVGGELASRRNRQAMVRASGRLDAARRDVVAARDVLASRGRA